MSPTFPAPVTAEAVGQDVPRSLQTNFTKCEESVQDDCRQAQVSCKSPTSELAAPHPKDERSHFSYLHAHTNQKASPELTSIQVKGTLVGAGVDDDNKEGGEDRRLTATAVGAVAGHPAHGRQNKPKGGKEVGKRPLVKRSLLARHVALSMIRKPPAQQQQHPQLERAEKAVAVFNIASGSLGRSRSANGSTGNARPSSFAFTAIQPSKGPHPLVQRAITNGFTNGHISFGNIALNGNANANGSVKPSATRNVSGNGSLRQAIVLASTPSEEFEVAGGEGSEEWTSEDMGAESKAREAEEARSREAILEAQRQRGLFAKAPERSYQDINRTQSRLLSQLNNPSPAVLLHNHSYWINRSSADISRQRQQPQQHVPVPRRCSSAYAPPRLSASKSAAALPMAAQVIAVSSSRPPTSSAMRREQKEKSGYRPKGPPKEQAMEDGSDGDAGSKIQMPQSVAQKKLQALMSRESSEQGTSSHLTQPVAMEVGSGLLSSATAPILLGNPYNLPAAALPVTPKTTRLRMLEAELSGSMRRQLLWERQVSSSTNLALAARRASQEIGGLRSLTSTSSGGIKDASTRSMEAQDKDERRCRATVRNRIWAGDYHYSGR